LRRVQAEEVDRRLQGSREPIKAEDREERIEKLIARFKGNTVKERLFDGLYVPHICALFGIAQEMGLDDQVVTDRLALDGATLNRWPVVERFKQSEWDKRPMPPAPRMFLGLLILGLRREITDRELSDQLVSNAAAVSNAMRRTMGAIRDRELGQGFAMPSRAEFTFIHRLIFDAESGPFASDPLRTMGTEVGRRVLRRVGEIVRGLHGEQQRAGMDPLRMIQAWSMPFMLLWLGLSAIWDYHDEALG
jgi:hypothetical protein